MPPVHAMRAVQVSGSPSCGRSSSPTAGGGPPRARRSRGRPCASTSRGPRWHLLGSLPMAKPSRGEGILDALRVEPGTGADLSERNPASRLGLGEKADGQARSAELLDVLDDLHGRLWAEARRG